MVKIVVRFGILIVVLVAIFLAFNLFVRRPMQDNIVKVQNELNFTQTIGKGLNLMLDYRDKWPDILSAQRRDVEFIRTVLPEAPFNEKVYLIIMLDIFSRSGVNSKGVGIRPVKQAASQVDFFSFVTADLGALAVSIQEFKTAFDYLGGKDNIAGKQRSRFDSLIVDQGASAEDLELALWYSYQFNTKMAINVPSDKALDAGFEIHRFDTTISGSYDNIKRFIWMVQNMRPHTVIVNWHLSPGRGAGEQRLYTASMTLVTFVDTNTPPIYEHDPNDKFMFIYDQYADLPDISYMLSMLGLK